MKVALVTGATRGIGKVIAITLARKGFAVVVTGRTLLRGQGNLGIRGASEPVPGSIEETVAEIEANGGTALGVALDLLSRDSIDAAIAQTVGRFGRLDVLVNNAIYQGPAIMQPFATFRMDDAEDNFRGTVVNQMYISRRAMEIMIVAGGGRMIFVTSASSAMPATGHWGLLYGAGKAAFNKIPEFIQLEHAKDGILTFLIEPQFTMTDTIRARWGDAAMELGAGTQAHDPIETANTAVWLATHDAAARFSGGQMINAPDFFRMNAIDPALD